MKLFKTAVNNAKTHDIIYSLCIAAPAAINQAKQFNLPEVISLRNLEASRWSPVKTLLLIAPDRISLDSTSLRPATIVANSLKELSTGVASVPVVSQAFKGSRIV